MLLGSSGTLTQALIVTLNPKRGVKSTSPRPSDGLRVMTTRSRIERGALIRAYLDPILIDCEFPILYCNFLGMLIFSFASFTLHVYLSPDLQHINLASQTTFLFPPSALYYRSGYLLYNTAFSLLAQYRSMHLLQAPKCLLGCSAILPQ
jgi:hypothetical protein